MSVQERFPNSIRQMRFRRMTAVVEVPDAYTFNPPSGLRGRFYSVLWAVLRWANSVRPHVETVETTHYTNLRSKKLHTAILEALTDARRDMRLPTQIVMGGSDFSALVASPEVRDSLTFEAGPFKRGGDPEIYGVKVHVVPWIKGWAVL